MPVNRSGGTTEQVSGLSGRDDDSVLFCTTVLFKHSSTTGESLLEEIVSDQDRHIVGWSLADVEPLDASFEHDVAFWFGETDEHLDRSGGRPSSRHGNNLGNRNLRFAMGGLTNMNDTTNSLGSAATNGGTVFLPTDLYIPWREDETLVVNSFQGQNGPQINQEVLIYWTVESMPSEDNTLV